MNLYIVKNIWKLKKHSMWKKAFNVFMKNNTSTTNIDWFRWKDENYYPKVFLEKCFVFEWKIPKNKIKCINLYQKKGSKLIISHLKC